MGASPAHALPRMDLLATPATEHLRRARHSQATFDKHYKRAVPPRVLAAATSHLRRSELRADEILFL